MKPITKEIAEKIDTIPEDWGNVDNFIDKGFGVCIMNMDEILSEYHVGYIGNREAELGVYTNVKYREKGFATIVSKAAIKECISRRLIPC